MWPTHFVGRIHRLCVTSKTINYNGGVHRGELCVSVLFLLDAAGLNKGPPTNTNTGSRALSVTASFLFSASRKMFQNAKIIWQTNQQAKCYRGVEIYTFWLQTSTLCVFWNLACQFNKMLFSTSKSGQQCSYSFDLGQLDRNSYRFYIAYGAQSVSVNMTNLRKGNIYTAEKRQLANQKWLEPNINISHCVTVSDLKTSKKKSPDLSNEASENRDKHS